MLYLIGPALRIDLYPMESSRLQKLMKVDESKMIMVDEKKRSKFCSLF